jgi:hypothetical protein
VNEASNQKDSLVDQIEIHEILGEGAFGKVNKGLWRGTVRIWMGGIRLCRA